MADHSSGEVVSSPAAQVLLDAAKIVRHRLMDARQLSAEYRSVVGLDSSIDHTVYTAQQPENLALNRYTNVLPYDYNLITCGYDRAYVNASTVYTEDRTSGMEFKYICSQGPLPTTVSHFWRMVLEQRVPVIVMLTNLVERGTAKCARYFPEQPGETMSTSSLQVAVLHSRTFADGQMTERVMQVSSREDSRSIPQLLLGPLPPPLTLYHFHFHAWPDHGTPPDSQAIRSICAALQVVRQQQQVQVQQSTQPAASNAQAQQPKNAQEQKQQQQEQQGAQEPRSSGEAVQGNGVVLGAQPCGSSGMCQALVHCSAGIGRTGTFLAIDIMIQRIRRLAARAAAAGSSSSVRGRLLSEAFNIPTLVHELRQQRMGMVQTFDQYSYIYRALQEELQDGLAKMGVLPAHDTADANAAGSVKEGSARRQSRPMA